MYMQVIENFKSVLKNLDDKNKRILKYGLSFCFMITIISVIILITYLFFVHIHIIYEIGILIFQISLYYCVFFIASAITVDEINKNVYK